jgi:hypothetical protein
MSILTRTTNGRPYKLKANSFFGLDKWDFIVYNSKVFKDDDEEEYTGDLIFRELPGGERQYEGPVEVASEFRVPTAKAQ